MRLAPAALGNDPLRHEATKRDGLHEIPVIVHYGYTDEEISFLADLDNENDEDSSKR
ncbi:MAG: hypothetical protein HSCHL_1345 [Hydrogenibacillus schlegelii]|uniref:Uncharacterized protein n=1 Tax=Hydrogenibacillus schlegelii TaxID=1484 RepID=A0A2T5G5A6_HYDSH|nr:hypothetical protein [Hydrogenibacillus schlegelii]PTQ51374.1 MAG: hypothetical protein HSCHL_1345 [Hydrogenibacillus schlegelii]